MAMLSSFKKNPINFIKRTLYKIIIGPLKYGKADDYDAARYWHDRFSKYGLSLKGAGHEGLSLEENEKMYAEAAHVFINLCRREKIDFRGSSVLEIGCGTGFYTQLFHSLGVKRYMGIDITDALFTEHKKKFPEYRFSKKDITSDVIEGNYDVIVMIDVIEHIVNEAKLSFAMENVKKSLSDNGVFVVAPIMNMSKKSLFYVRAWSLEDVQGRFPGFIFGELVPFRNGHILSVRKP